MKKIAISIGDLNGIGLEIALRSHEQISQWCEPIYCIDPTMLSWGAAVLNIEIPQDLHVIPCKGVFEITPGVATKASGEASYHSFLKALELVQSGQADALVTLPINKEAWQMATIPYRGHTDALDHLLGEKAIMMLGCKSLYVALYTHHIPIKDVPKQITKKALNKFLLRTYEALHVKPIGVLGLNPHAGDGGVIGKEDRRIAKAIQKANEILGEEIFIGPLVPDTAFTPNNLVQMSHFVSMYHDQGLIPVKTLYFEESINVSLGLSIIRTSVDHGTAYDIAYKNESPSTKSYQNAILKALFLALD
jgi:4-hydroxythreonine-4-phosphate dehydrogenase